MPEQQALAGISVAFYAGTALRLENLGISYGPHTDLYMLGSPCQAEACKISLLPSVASEAFGAGPGEVGQIFSGLAALAIGGPLPATE